MLADVVRTDAHQLRPAAGDSPAAEGGQGAGPHAQDADLAAGRGGAAAAGPAAGVLPGRGGRVRGPGRPGRAGTAGQGAGPGPRREADPRPGLGGAQAGRPLQDHGQDRRDPGRAAQPAAGPAARPDRRLRGHRAVPDRGDRHPQRAGRRLQGQVEAHFGQHPDAEIYLSQPGLGAITGARVLGEFGDDPHRYACAKARRNYAGTSPITRASGKKKIVAARFVHNDRLIDALMIQAFAALRVSPGARAFYDAATRQRDRAQRRPATTGQPARRHPARMPQDPHLLRRGHRLGPPRKHRPISPSPLDIQNPGMSWLTILVYRQPYRADLQFPGHWRANLRTNSGRASSVHNAVHGPAGLIASLTRQRDGPPLARSCLPIAG